MLAAASKEKIIIFDTTMRDGEMMPGVTMNVDQKVYLAKLLEEMQVDVIEVGYPGAFEKDFDEIFSVSKQVKNAVICGLSSSQPDEITRVALALKPAIAGRINLYTSVHLKDGDQVSTQQTLELISNSITLARNYTEDIQWTAFDATRSHPDFLCQAVETAIRSGATTISIPDSLGIASPENFTGLIKNLVDRVPNLDQATIAVHCHNDLGKAVENSIAAIAVGARQIECSINGLGARRGNADLAAVVTAIAQQSEYSIEIEPVLLASASEWVTQFTEIERSP
jgi:2-isopropylmalate synthase